MKHVERTLCKRPVDDWLSWWGFWNGLAWDAGVAEMAEDELTARGLERAQRRDYKRRAAKRDRQARVSRKHSYRDWARWGYRLEQVRLSNPGRLDQEWCRDLTARAVQTAWHQLVETGRAQRFTSVLKRLGRMGALPVELIHALPEELVQEQVLRWSSLPWQIAEGLVGTRPRLTDPVCRGVQDTLFAGLTVVMPDRLVTYADISVQYKTRVWEGGGRHCVLEPLWLADGFDDDNCWQGSVAFWPRAHVSSHEYKSICEGEAEVLLGGDAGLVILRPVWAEGLRLWGGMDG